MIRDFSLRWNDVGSRVYKEINENIKVMALFDHGKIVPKKFRWYGRDYQVKEISLAYQQREGKSMNYYFGLETTDDNVFKLVFNSENMNWVVAEVWND